MKGQKRQTQVTAKRATGHGGLVNYQTSRPSSIMQSRDAACLVSLLFCIVVGELYALEARMSQRVT